MIRQKENIGKGTLRRDRLLDGNLKSAGPYTAACQKGLE